ncbi:hypothetical protein GUITHDRAFT_163748 [Guillardia theta CCMP2712]|uniref:Uncharacterized protein n=1 Tax=Guillardia theta (strain CCMP2712) TaxID=905079 RepID=L1J641_GUITC|nr:hypothetical protein GUITHDRAFT_163748 [Guillardia theta CCMP2712]EKX43767.1 hypothetical protein GUITHDRAFT_163748 [Guillardia theta CCMP2712]|mmetsp:Transcript_7293/g.25085  ORF Transcript_7293/g.25085 Transcript_7293/m.25085 type:complete len:205 (+) Transcript_7293:68-682(+)|eukprot:XP_005830747.1 hypothetical protein GUITHDRAFT_163748 [Guillardia theta CCMP2712]
MISNSSKLSRALLQILLLHAASSHAHVPTCLHLRGGSQKPTIDPEYSEILQKGSLHASQSMGSIETEDVGEKLPWPEGSESKKESFQKYQAQYKEAKDEYRQMKGKLQIAEHQQQVQKITLKGLKSLEPEADVYLPVGRMYVSTNQQALRTNLEESTERVLEEIVCETQAKVEELQGKVKSLELKMQEVLNHVFRGRFQLFMET